MELFLFAETGQNQFVFPVKKTLPAALENTNTLLFLKNPIKQNNDSSWN